MNIRKIATAMAFAVIALAASAAKPVEAVFTVNPQMHCANCENKIKSNLRFEKGVKGVETSVEEQKVVVRYDPDKTSEEALAKAFSKIGYEATPLGEGEGTCTKSCGGESQCTQNQSGCTEGNACCNNGDTENR